MSNRSTKAQTTHDGSNSRVQKMTKKFETLITSQQQKQQVHPPPSSPQQLLLQQVQSVHNFPPKEAGSTQNDQCPAEEPESLRDLEARRGIKRSQAFRRSTSQTSSINGGNMSASTKPQLNHSESIREALNKPLPDGPPPAKPPRACGRGFDDIGHTLSDGERMSDSEYYEDVNMLIEVAYQEPGKSVHDSPSGEQISLKRPMSEEHRKRLRRMSRCAELNHYTQQYGTIRLYDEVDKGNAPNSTAECKTADTKGLIKHYNKLSTVEKCPAPPQSLYEYCIVVGYDMMQNKPYVKSRYPRHKQPHKMIEVFVYPDNGALVRNRNQQYCIILTDHSSRMYGFCRRVLPESSEFCIPLTYCLVTKHNEPKVFYKLLECIESQHGNGRVPELLMEQFYDQRLPSAGERLALTLPVSFEVHSTLRQEPSLPTTMTINRPKDLRLEKTELYDIFKCLGSDGLIHVFECLLLEKMVILFSEHISLLTSCVQGLLLILYPFQWHHILVTVIPEDMQPILEAPVPVLAGTLQPVPEGLWESSNMCYVNLDKGTVRLPVCKQLAKEQISILPNELKKPLRVSLDLVKMFEDSKGLASVLIGGAFVRFFVELFSTLDPRTYKKASFLTQFANTESEIFLNSFLETVMFADFLKHWQSSKHAAKTPSPTGSFDYTLYNSKIAEKSQTKYWHSATFDEVVANSKHIQRKGKTFISKMKGLMKKS